MPKNEIVEIDGIQWKAEWKTHIHGNGLRNYLLEVKFSCDGKRWYNLGDRDAYYEQHNKAMLSICKDKNIPIKEME